MKDNGAGFETKHADLLFRAYERMHAQKNLSGTGVGLATVQRIIEKHGGRIWAEGRPNEGAALFFTLQPKAIRKLGCSKPGEAPQQST